MAHEPSLFDLLISHAFIRKLPHELLHLLPVLRSLLRLLVHLDQREHSSTAADTIVIEEG